MGASLRVGLSEAQLREVIQVLAESGDGDAARRASEALDAQLAALQSR